MVICETCHARPAAEAFLDSDQTPDWCAACATDAGIVGVLADDRGASSGARLEIDLATRAIRVVGPGEIIDGGRAD